LVKRSSLLKPNFQCGQLQQGSAKSSILGVVASGVVVRVRVGGCGCLIERENMESGYLLLLSYCLWYRRSFGSLGVRWRGGQVENRLLGAGEVAGNVSCVPAGGAGGHLGTGFDEEHFERYRGKSFGGLGGFKKVSDGGRTLLTERRRPSRKG
jgi:hypothetical protein